MKNEDRSPRNSDDTHSLSTSIKSMKHFLVGFSQMFQFVGNRTEHCLGSSVDHFAEIAAIESSRLEKGRPSLL